MIGGLTSGRDLSLAPTVSVERKTDIEWGIYE